MTAGQTADQTEGQAGGQAAGQAEVKTVGQTEDGRPWRQMEDDAAGWTDNEYLVFIGQFVIIFLIQS